MRHEVVNVTKPFAGLLLAALLLPIGVCAEQNPPDCEYIDATPRISSVDVPANGEGGGPYVPVNVAAGIIIQSMGAETEVPNPAYDGVGGLEPETILRDYGFGCGVGLPNVTIGGVPVTVNCATTDGVDVLTGTAVGIPQGAQQIVVTRVNGNGTVTGLTVQVGLRTGSNVLVVDNGSSVTANGGVVDYVKIQDAINAAGTNDLILVAPGIYDEMVIMWKPVQLQGWGEGSTSIDAIKAPSNKLADWRVLAESLLNSGEVDLAPGQNPGFGSIEPAIFSSEEGAGVLVLGKSNTNKSFAQGSNRGARIDGFTISGADTGGGIVVNGYGDYLDISNNRVVNNSAFFAGGVRVGHPLLTSQQGNNITNSDADNDNVNIHHNTITRNSGLNGAGGGLGLHTGSDSYQVTDNFVCGNFTTAGGAGIAHYGFSDAGLIKDNTVIFNENFNQGTTVNGGGILVSGMPAFGCPIDPVTGLPVPACLTDAGQMLTQGSGSVSILANLIQGNLAGVGDGAGIRLNRINGQDIIGPDETIGPPRWTINIINNMIVDNVAALAGGGISLQDALDVNILHNTIANNNNASVSGDAFTTGHPNNSNPQPGAGIVSRAHSAELTQFAGAGFSDANMQDNIIWKNRKFYWTLEDDNLPVKFGLCPDINGDAGLTCTDGNNPAYDELAVIPFAAGALSCTDCIVIGDGDPAFVAEYVNGNRNSTTILEGTTSMQALPAFGEGYHFIRLRFGPLTRVDSDTGDLFGDYHIQSGSSAKDSGADAGVSTDFDGEPRPSGRGFDIGADETFR